MNDVKRILWVDDNPQNKASAMFDQAETKNVSTMDEALREIAGKRLYEYDTIILDIDFEDGLLNADNVIQTLLDKLYLNTDQQNKQFVINNGGYLLFLYLLEKGYPSEQVAFLTGNGPMIQKLREYNLQNANPMSREKIAEKFIQIWNELDDDDDKYDNFASEIEQLPIAVEYTDDDFVNDCIDILDVYDGETIDAAALKQCVSQVEVKTVTGDLHNTGDMMIYRFHEANLKAPIYFSKNENDIRGHNREDAQKWLNERRTMKNVSRWLILSAANRIEQLFRDTDANITGCIQDILKNTIGDGGVRNAYRQMFFVLDGLRSQASDGAYYQAISAMLMPFEAFPREYANTVHEEIPNLKEDETIRRMLSFCTKQARNFCAHNSFGSSLNETTALFLLLISTTTLLKKEERKNFHIWYQKIADAMNYTRTAKTDTIAKINGILEHLVLHNEIDFIKSKTDKNDYPNWTIQQKVIALGYRKAMKNISSVIREQYYLFVLASYIVLWFDDMNPEDVSKKFGEEVLIIYEIALEMVKAY